MKKFVKSSLLHDLHAIPSFKRSAFVKDELREKYPDLQNESELIVSILDEFDSSIGVLNSKQFENIIKIIKTDFSLSAIGIKLDLYNIKPEYFESILNFCNDYYKNLDAKLLDDTLSTDLEITFQNFKKIIKQGWIGDWESNPEDDNMKMVKIPAFIESGKKKRFFLAKIFKTIPIRYQDKIRYRVYFLNPKIKVT